MIEKYENADVWGSKTLLDKFEENVEKDPDRTAVVDPPNTNDLIGRDPERLTYEELSERVDAVATGLIKKGIEKDDIVVVQLPNSWELAMLYLAISKAGGIISPLPVQWRQREIRHVMELTKSKAIITIEEFNEFNHVEMCEKIQKEYSEFEKIITSSDVQEMSGGKIDGEELGEVEIGANEVFNIQWTSGTTAEPKACPITHNNWFSDFVAPLCQVKEGSKILCVAPLVNMTALGVMYIPWILICGTLILHHPIDFELMIQQMQEEDINFTIMVPALLNLLLKHPKVDEFDLSSVDTITVGSAAPSEWSLRESKERWDIDIINIWGQNEGTGIVSGPLTTPLERRATDFPIFKEDVDWEIDDPRAEAIRMKIVDPDTGKELTEVGEIGELAYRGPLTMAEYFRQPELTEEAFDDEGYFYTGDLFKIAEDNHMSFFDRKKDVIIRGGFTISAKEIENIALEHEKIADAAAVAMPDPNMGEKTCLYVVPKEEGLTLEDITSFMEDEVAVYKLPERLEIVDEIPRTPVGKIRKTELREDIEEKLRDDGIIE